MFLYLKSCSFLFKISSNLLNRISFFDNVSIYRSISLFSTSNVVFYTANRTNNKFLLEKRLFNIKQIHDSKLIEHLKQELINPSIILFGSYAKGEDVENSDIDLYIETLSKKEIRLSKFEEILKRKLQLFRYRNIKNVSNAHLANNIVNGITLNGFVEVFK